MADVALLDRDGPDDAPRLLVVDAFEPEPGVRRLSILSRDSAWGVASDLRVDVGGSHLLPWLVGLGPDRFALLAVSAESDETVLIGLQTDAGPGRNELALTGRSQLGTQIDDAGAADVDGDGTIELVVATARTLREGGTCQGSIISVLDGSSLSMREEYAAPGRRLAGGVIGQWDEVPGDDLLAYAYDNCPAGPDTAAEASLIAIRLSDGARVLDDPSIGPRPEAAPFLGVPMRLDLDGRDTNEVLAQGAEGLAVMDPAAGWTGLPLASGAAAPTVTADDPDEDGPAVRVAWIDVGDLSSVGTARLRRTPAGALDIVGLRRLQVGDLTDRPASEPARLEAIGAQSRQTPAAGWIGATTDEGCPDLLLPGARLSCGSAELAPGAAWIGTRPLTVVMDGPMRRLLVAGGLALDPSTMFPQTPAPWATAPAGWWRHGPSAPFALAELSAGDATYYRDFPVPRASVERTTDPDATTAVPGFTGVRLFVRATALEPEATDPTGDTELDVFLREQVLAPGGIDVLRIQVPPGVEAGRDGGFARISLGGLTLADGSRADRWSIALVPINDWGEIGSVATGVVIRDMIGPSLVIEPPFTSAVWPFPAVISGSAEPRSTVVVAGVGSVELDRRGQFAIRTPLAPWPQTIVVTATDASGNVTRREVSVIGGVDYRRFPWAHVVAAALLIAVVASGLIGNRWRRGVGGQIVGPGRAAYAVDDGPVAEIEDLPPGAGLR